MSELTCKDCTDFQSGRCLEEDEEGEICERFQQTEDDKDD